MKIKFTIKSKDSENSEKCNANVALNTLFMNNSDENNIEIKPAYISEYNLIREKLSYFLWFLVNIKRHDLAAK